MRRREFIAGLGAGQLGQADIGAALVAKLRAVIPRLSAAWVEATSPYVLVQDRARLGSALGSFGNYLDQRIVGQRDTNATRQVTRSSHCADLRTDDVGRRRGYQSVGVPPSGTEARGRWL
jgi:hypothetical protein